MTGYLASILHRKRAEVARLQEDRAALQAATRDAPPPRPWHGPLALAERVALIAEIKRKAPSAGDLRPDLDPAALARVYAGAGAAAISVLTDSDFAGTPADLSRAREAVDLPILRKDFIIDSLQLFESRAAGADAVLLIAAALEPGQLADLTGAARELGLGTLVEVHDEEELGHALDADAPVIGINNRDLTTFETRRERALELLPLVPRARVAVAESGIDSAEHVAELGARGCDAVLVGTALIRAADPGRLARELAAQPKRARP